MLRILGSEKRLCDGMTRRDMLRAGGLGFFGLGLSDLLHWEAGASPEGKSKAKSCILLYLYGAASQLETFDLKPAASDDVRGAFKPIPTSVPGLQICEHMPRTAERMNKVALIRSMTHPYNIHSVAYTVTGTPTSDGLLELFPHDPRQWPFFGSVLEYLNEHRGPSRDSPYATGASRTPGNIALPWKFSSRLKGPVKRSGPYAAFLGSGYDPVWTEFKGEATKDDPYGGVTPNSRFIFTQESDVELTLDRLHQRRSLLEQLDDIQPHLEQSLVGQGLERHRSVAFEMLTSPKLRQALDVDCEPANDRERYGMTLFGQATLAARRLIEGGVRLVSVFWDEYGPVNSAWDTHFHQFKRLKDELCPGFDMAFSALLDDLSSRGLLDETLVVVLTEHGRTPKITKKAAGTGREHWSGAYSQLLAGAGIKPGYVHGSTDKNAGYPNDCPTSPKDVLCTIYHLLGIDPRTEIHDRLGRPMPLVSQGRILHELLG